MNRTQKLKYNTIMSLVNRIVRIISGLILPRLILLYFGSRTNGLVASITQFLNIITFLDLGVGTVVQSALYRPLAKKNQTQINSILVAAKSYFNKIAFALVIYVAGLIIFYPLLIDSSFGFLSTGFLIFALSISLFGQYYFGIVNELFLNADQRSYIQYGSEIIVVILNIVVSILLITQGASIQIVKLGAGLVFLLRPMYLSYYVNKNYEIDLNVELEEDPLPQKWSGMGQHIAYTIQNSTDVVVLTVFSTLENISVYSVYNMVVQSISLLISSMTTGISSFFGDLLAREETTLLNKYFSQIEWLIHTGVVYLYGMTAILINSFVMIYTSGVEDIDYYVPLFSLLLVLAKASYSLRIPYQSIIFSAGHFKQTQRSSFIEAGINIIISIIMVSRFGLVGVAIGTLTSMLYRTLYLANYLSRNIIFRPIKIFLKHILVDLISIGTMLAIGNIILNINSVSSLLEWVVLAIGLSILTLIVVFLINLIFYKKIMVSTLSRILKRN